jgi:hypothetical protein
VAKSDGLGPGLRGVAIQNLLVDSLTAEVTGLFEAAGIDVMLIKGPLIGDWLYADGARSYGDSDLLIRRADWERAVALLAEHGFENQLGPMAHPRMESYASTAFVRGTQNVDLHCTIAGLDTSYEAVWERLWPDAGRMTIGGRSVAVPPRAGVLVHIALHAAHHHDEDKPKEDLRRALAATELEEWRAAAELAGELGGLAAFASGLRYEPEGERVVSDLGLEREGSVHFELRAAGVPTAEGLHELLAPGLAPSERLALIRDELFPRPGFMRWWMPLARRGRRGLIASYPLRWLLLALRLPRGLATLLRARRKRRLQGDG